MKKLFTMIRQGNLEEVRYIIEKRPDLIACTATAPPKKDHGQSPLMVAIKSDNLDVAHLLLDLGADVNFRDTPNPYDRYGLSAPIWLDVIGQCYLRAKDTVSEQSKERTKQYYLLLRRLLDIGMNPNQKINKSHYYAGVPRNAWVAALDEYSYFSIGHYSSYNQETEELENRQLQELTAAILKAFFAHGVDIYDLTFQRGDNVSYILWNLIFNRDILDGINKENENTRTALKQVWEPMDAILRPYYAKDNPYYNAEVSKERIEMYQILEQQEKSVKEKIRKELKEAHKRGPVLNILPEWVYMHKKNDEFLQEILQENKTYFEERNISFTEDAMLTIISGSYKKEDILNALVTLRQIGTKKSIPYLKQIAGSSDKRQQILAVSALTELAKGEENEFISSLLLASNFKEKIHILYDLFSYEDKNCAAVANVLEYSKKTTKGGKKMSSHLRESRALDWAYLALYAPDLPEVKQLFDKINQNREYIDSEYLNEYIKKLSADFPEIFPFETEN